MSVIISPDNLRALRHNGFPNLATVSMEGIQRVIEAHLYYLKKGETMPSPVYRVALVATPGKIGVYAKDNKFVAICMKVEELHKFKRPQGNQGEEREGPQWIRLLYIENIATLYAFVKIQVDERTLDQLVNTLEFAWTTEQRALDVRDDRALPPTLSTTTTVQKVQPRVVKGLVAYQVTKQRKNDMAATVPRCATITVIPGQIEIVSDDNKWVPIVMKIEQLRQFVRPEGATPWIHLDFHKAVDNEFQFVTIQEHYGVMSLETLSDAVEYAWSKQKVAPRRSALLADYVAAPLPLSTPNAKPVLAGPVAKKTVWKIKVDPEGKATRPSVVTSFKPAPPRKSNQKADDQKQDKIAVPVPLPTPNAKPVSTVRVLRSATRRSLDNSVLPASKREITPSFLRMPDSMRHALKRKIIPFTIDIAALSIGIRSDAKKKGENSETTMANAQSDTNQLAGAPLPTVPSMDEVMVTSESTPPTDNAEVTMDNFDMEDVNDETDRRLSMEKNTSLLAVERGTSSDPFELDSDEDMGQLTAKATTGGLGQKKGDKVVAPPVKRPLARQIERTERKSLTSAKAVADFDKFVKKPRFSLDSSSNNSITLPELDDSLEVETKSRSVMDTVDIGGKTDTKHTDKRGSVIAKEPISFDSSLGGMEEEMVVPPSTLVRRRGRPRKEGGGGGGDAAIGGPSKTVVEHTKATPIAMHVDGTRRDNMMFAKGYEECCEVMRRYNQMGEELLRMKSEDQEEFLDTMGAAMKEYKKRRTGE